MSDARIGIFYLGRTGFNDGDSLMSYLIKIHSFNLEDIIIFVTRISASQIRDLSCYNLHKAPN